MTARWSSNADNPLAVLQWLSGTRLETLPHRQEVYPETGNDTTLHAKVLTEGLNVRAAASTESQVLRTLPLNTIVEVTAVALPWLRISDGYIHAGHAEYPMQYRVPWYRLDPKVTSRPGGRHPRLLEAVIRQFDVERNRRYRYQSGLTYCNIFVWDVSVAMGAEIPHWVNASAAPVTSDQPSGNQELNANMTYDWLRDHGAAYGWTSVTAIETQAYANLGYPAIATWKNPNTSRSGHIAVVRPGSYSRDNGPHIAQAGATNTESTRVAQQFTTGWRNNTIAYYVHD